MAGAQDEAFEADAFVTGYIAAFEARDCRRVSAFYDAPFLSVRADGSAHTFSDEAETDRFFGSVLEAYSQDGMAGFDATDIVGEPMGRASYRLSCTWSMTRSDGSVIREWRQTYIFRLSQPGWKIIASIFHL